MIPAQLLPLLGYDDYLGIAREGTVVVPVVRRAVIGKMRLVPSVRGVVTCSPRIHGRVQVKPRIASRGGTAVAPSPVAELPGSMTLTVTPLFKRVAVQLNATPAAGTYIDAYVDCQVGGHWRRGTYLYQRYGANEYYGNVFNLPENTVCTVRTTVRVRDSATDSLLATYERSDSDSTLNSATPQSAATTWYVDPSTPVTGDGMTALTPFKWLNDNAWQPGDIIRLVTADFSVTGTSAARRTITGAVGTATNWIRVIPHDASVKFYLPLTLNGPWTDETAPRAGVHSGMPGVWSMTIASGSRLIGVVRDETTGYEIYPHSSLSNVSDTDPGVKEGWDSTLFPAFPTQGPAGFFAHADAATPMLYIRTQDGLVPPNDRFIGGYYTGLALSNCQYVSLEDIKSEMMLSCSASGTAQGSNSGITISATAGNSSHHVYLKRCEFDSCNLRITAVATGPVHSILADECRFERHGYYETFYQRVNYSESQPYDSDFGYGPVKGSNASRWAVRGSGVGQVTLRNCEAIGYPLYADLDTSDDGDRGKNLDIYQNECSEITTGTIDLTDFGYVNAAIWANHLDHSAEPIAMSPVDEGPVWMFANYGDGVLHVPFKLGIQISPYDDDNGHSFKIIANNSFAAAGYTNNETHANQRFQGCYSGVIGPNNVFKGYQSTEASPLGDWFSYADPFTGEHLVEPDRINRWSNGLIYVKNKAASSVRPKVYWNSVAYDIAHPTAPVTPEATEIIWDRYLFGWSANGDVDPFLTTVAAGLNPAITRKSLYVRGITDCAGDEDGNAVLLQDLPIGYFPLRDSE